MPTGSGYLHDAPDKIEPNPLILYKVIFPAMIIDDDFKYNARGAKVYKDPLRHEILDIPRLSSTKEKGVIYEVLSVGVTFSDLCIPTVTIMKNGEPIVYRLPDWYLGWAEMSIRLNSQYEGMFPCLVEFGYLVSEGKYFAELL